MKKYILNAVWMFAFVGFFRWALVAYGGGILKPIKLPQYENNINKETGIPNFYHVDQKLYRSAQPKDSDFDTLYKMGIHRILNLRQYHNDQNQIGDLPIEEYRVPMSVFLPKYDDLVKAVRYIIQTDTAVLVHCMQGSDRTGAIVAAYRITVQKWSKHRAIKEMTNGVYGYHGKWVKFEKLLNSLDVNKFRHDISSELRE